MASVDLVAIEAALAPHPQGASAWAEALCDLDPRVGLRGAIAAADLVAPIWRAHSPDGEEFGQTLAAAQAVLDDPCPETIKAARESALEAGRRMRGDTGPEIDALRVAYYAAEAARYVQDDPSKPATYVHLGFLKAIALSEPGVLGGTVQDQVLAWLEAEDGPIAAEVSKRARRSARAAQGKTKPARKKKRRPKRKEPDGRTATPEASPPPARPVALQWSAPPRAAWRIGHKVKIRPSMEVTCLGEGVVVDLEFERGTETVKAALVRFEDGPADGVWYSVNTLLPHEDLFGTTLH